MNTPCSPVTMDDAQRQAEQYKVQAEEWVQRGYYLEAAHAYEKSAAAEQSGPTPRVTPIVEALNIAGYCYDQLCQYSQALKLYEQALEFARNSGWGAGIAPVLRNIGGVYEVWGQYANALDYFEQAIALNRQLGQDAEVAKGLNHIGRVYKAWGQYADALKYYEQALDLNHQLGQDVESVEILRNIGVVYHSWGRYANALEYYERALALARELGRNFDVATIFNNIGRAYHSWGLYADALTYFQHALTLARQSNREADIARGLNNLGVAYYALRQFDEALSHYTQALTLNQQLGRGAAIVSDLNHIGQVYEASGQPAQALEHYQHALMLARDLQRNADIARSLDNLGRVSYARQHYAEAIAYLMQAVDIKEQLRKTATGDVRRDYLASEIDTYHVLTACYVRTGNLTRALEVIELSRARRLTEQLAQSETDLGHFALARFQATLPEDTAVLVYANTDLPEMIVLLITKEALIGKELSHQAFIQHVMPDYQPEIAKVLADAKKNKRQTVIPREKEDGMAGDEKESAQFAEFIACYRLLLTNPNATSSANALGARLYDLLIGNVQAELQGKTKLLIIPDGMLHFLPFETLVRPQGRYVVEDYTISYAQSLRSLELIGERDYPQDRSPLLAFGGAVYNPQTYQTEMTPEAEQPGYLPNWLDRAMSTEASLHVIYTSLGYGNWQNLPGTLREVQTIQQVVKDADILTGNAVTKSTIKELSADGLLARYKIVHFATHGIAVPELPELSALVLSQHAEPSAPEDDGYLRISEIAQLRLNADFVNLSACETGLGKVYSGEGVVGLTQAFLLAGANRLAVSLWRVADDSTTAFMAALYRLVAEDGLSYADAIAEVKRRFINGEFGAQCRAPRYWAPFVYYGKR